MPSYICPYCRKVIEFGEYAAHLAAEHRKAPRTVYLIWHKGLKMSRLLGVFADKADAEHELARLRADVEHFPAAADRVYEVTEAPINEVLPLTDDG